MTLNRSERRLLAVLCVVAACAFYWFCIFTPAQSSAAQLSAEIEAAREAAGYGAQGAERIERLREDVREAEERIEMAFPALSAGRDQAAWTRAVEKVCSGGARLVALRFAEDEGDGALGAQAAQLEALVGQNGVSAFVDALSGGDTLMRVEQLTIALEEGGQCRVKAVLSIPYAAQ